MEDLGVIFLAILIIVVPIVVVFWKIFKKAGVPGYTTLIPFYNGFILFDIADRGFSFIILLFIDIKYFDNL